MTATRLTARMADLPESGWIRQAGLWALADVCNPAEPGLVELLTGAEVSETMRADIVASYQRGFLQLSAILHFQGLLVYPEIPE